MNTIKETYVMETYGTKTLEFVKGKGCFLYNNRNESI